MKELVIRKHKLIGISGRKLDFNARDLINTALVTAYKKQIPPMSIITLENNYRDLYFLLVQKEKGKGEVGRDA